MRTQTETKRVLFEKPVYKMMIKIKNELKPVDVNNMTRNELITDLVDQIKTTSDELGTPIFKIKSKLFIYNNGEPHLIYGDSFKAFLAWCCKHVEIPEEIIYDHPFREQLLGCCWRELKPDE